MILNQAEIEYLTAMCGVQKDQEIADHLTILRVKNGISEKDGESFAISVDQIRKTRYKLGIKKGHGRGVCRVVVDQPTILGG